jgi:hypothetical protein
MLNHNISKKSKEIVFACQDQSSNHFDVVDEADMGCSTDEIIQVSEITYKVLFKDAKIDIDSRYASLGLL